MHIMNGILATAIVRRIEVLHTYKNPGYYTVTLTLNDGSSTSQATMEVFAYRKLIILVTDQSENKDSIEIQRIIPKERGLFETIETMEAAPSLFLKKFLQKN